MTESKSHKQAKTSGSKGRARTEVKIPGGRLDAKIGNKAREVERGGSSQGIKRAIQRLNTQKTSKKELLVSNKDLDKAKKIGEKTAKGKLTIQNLGRTKRRFIK